MLLLDIFQINALDDGLLFFSQVLQYPADFFKKELATRRFRRVLSVIAQERRRTESPIASCFPVTRCVRNILLKIF